MICNELFSWRACYKYEHFKFSLPFFGTNAEDKEGERDRVAVEISPVLGYYQDPIAPGSTHITLMSQFLTIIFSDSFV